MVASYSGHYDCVKDLIMQGADINYQREVWRENSVRLCTTKTERHSQDGVLFNWEASWEDAKRWSKAQVALKNINCCFYTCFFAAPTVVFVLS